MSNGIAILTTSSGTLTIISPFKENIIMIVNSNAINVSGLILGINTFSYHCLPFNLTSTKRVNIPAIKGI